VNRLSSDQSRQSRPSKELNWSTNPKDSCAAAAAARLAHGDKRVEHLPRWHFAATEDPNSCICCCTHDWKGLMPARFICLELAACIMCGLLLRREPVFGTHSKQKACICKKMDVLLTLCHAWQKQLLDIGCVLQLLLYVSSIRYCVYHITATVELRYYRAFQCAIYT